MPNKQTANFTLHLLKLKSDGDPIENRFADTRRDVQIGECVGRLYIDKKFANPPRWSKHFVALGIDAAEFGEAAIPGAALLLDIEGRTFAVTFGTGRFILKPDSFEERFGLLVVLNSIKPDAIKSIDKKTIDAISKQTREQASREIDAQAFGLDIERDMLKAVAGTPTESSLGQRLAGSNSLKVLVRAELQDLPALTSAYYAKFKDKTYKENFPWVDQITEVKQKLKRQELDRLLVDCIAKRKFERCWLAAPDIMDWNVVVGFRYGSSTRHEVRPDLDFSDFIACLNDPPFQFRNATSGHKRHGRARGG